MHEVIVKDLGRADYRDVWSLQETVQQRLIEDKLAVRRNQKDRLEWKEVLLLVEHPHVYTLGKSGNDQNMLMSSEQLQHLEADFVHIDRGGDITYHGPGQIVGYPILDLARREIGIKQYIWSLEQVVIDTLAEYDVKGDRVGDYTGVWVGDAKICAIGIKASRYVTMHGFALNVNTSLQYFDYIVPCGINHKSVTSLQELLGREIDLGEVKEILIRQIERQFDCNAVLDGRVPELEGQFSYLGSDDIQTTAE